MVTITWGPFMRRALTALGATALLACLGAAAMAPSFDEATVARVIVKPDSVATHVGDTTTFTATVIGNGGKAIQASVVWTVNDTLAKIASATGSSARVVALAPGHSVVTAANGKKKDTGALGIVAPLDTATLARVLLTPASVSLTQGAVQVFTVVDSMSDGTTKAFAGACDATGRSASVPFDPPGCQYTAGDSAGTFRIIATEGSKADTSDITITAVTLARVYMTPATASLLPGGVATFTVIDSMSNGTTRAFQGGCSSAGGTFSGCTFTAGSVAGTYPVIAYESGVADTSLVTITAPATLARVYMTPNTVTLAPGATQVFTVVDSMSDGSTKAFAGTCSALGGTFSGKCTYIAGTVGGVYSLYAVEGSKADTSTITNSGTPPPPPDPCGRTLNVSTIGGFTSALGAALPGDCINMAAGTYTLASNLTISRSGTAAQPITIRGAGSSTIVSGASMTKSVFVTGSYLKFVNLRFTSMTGGSAIYCQGMTYSVFDSVEVDHSTQGSIRLRDASHHNLIARSLFHDTGLGLHPEWGEAIYIGNSGDVNYPLQFTNTDNVVLNNHFGPNVSSQAVDVKEGSDRTTIRGNVIDGTGTQDLKSAGSVSLIDVIASHVTIVGNTMAKGAPQGVTFYAPTTVTMTGNLIDSNTVDLQNIHSVDFSTRPFYAFNLPSTAVRAGTVYKCSNVVTNGHDSQVTCVP